MCERGRGGETFPGLLEKGGRLTFVLGITTHTHLLLISLYINFCGGPFDRAYVVVLSSCPPLLFLLDGSSSCFHTYLTYGVCIFHYSMLEISFWIELIYTNVKPCFLFFKQREEGNSLLVLVLDALNILILLFMAFKNLKHGVTLKSH